MDVFIVGSGKLAKALLSSPISIPSCELKPWDSSLLKLHERAILVHAGSGRQLKECISFCSRTKSIFIELSTGLETETMRADFPMILCPNTSILLLKTLYAMKALGTNSSDYVISILESHQATKKTEPGTAFAFAKALHFPVDKIVSVRDPLVQEQELGIPREYLDKHAYHKITLSGHEEEVIIETKVLGHRPYAGGVEKLIRAVMRNPLENRRYTVLELIERNII